MFHIDTISGERVMSLLCNLQSRSLRELVVIGYSWCVISQWRGECIASRLISTGEMETPLIHSTHSSLRTYYRTRLFWVSRHGPSVFFNNGYIDKHFIAQEQQR